MLIALELAGFKSFAEKTRFDFPDGITVIVGPNGSGKSNVVDAIKWVLGAQSAKALRGKDMIDVIFKGSSSAGRKPSNSAEATLVFDNSEKLLDVDSEEVTVTRRVYRSGEGEYLINGQTCRLKDIKDLFRGTGVGVDAYSLIEQGKVDRMLQASPKDRRTIFEEAAGISKFNAKKVEANRRLTRVDQNLTRLKDIVDEVHLRLNSLKNQATKAQRFREMNSRLQEIRTQLGCTELLEYDGKIDSLTSRIEQLEVEQTDRQEELAIAQREARDAELELHSVAEKCQEVESVLQENLQSIAVCQNRQKSLNERIGETDSEINRQAFKLGNLRSRACSLQEEVDTLLTNCREAQKQFDDAQATANEAAEKLESLRSAASERIQAIDSLRNEHVGLLRRVSEMSSKVTEQKNLRSELQQSIYETEQQITKKRDAEHKARQQAERSAEKLKLISRETQEVGDSLATAKSQLESNREELQAHQESSAVLTSRLTGTTERLELLEQLEQHLEGVDAGARSIIAQAQSSEDPAFKSVVGLVAELLSVDVNLAALIDTALGQTANAVVVKDGQLVQLLRSGKLEVPGRLTLMRLDRIANSRFGEKIQLEGVRGVIGRADRLVKCEPQVEPLIQSLLGTTWLVDSLDTALDLGHFRGAGLRFVTAECQLVDANGTLTIGAIQSSSGLISRRSEIDNARTEIQQIKSDYQKAQGSIARLSARTEQLVEQVKTLESKSKELTQEFARQQATAQSSVAKLDELEVDAELLTKTLAELTEKKSSIDPNIEKTNLEVNELQQRIGVVEAELEKLEKTNREHELTLETTSSEETHARVELARCEQRLESVTAAYEQSTRSQEERVQAVEEAEEELKRLHTKRSQYELEILDLTSKLAEYFLISESEDAKLEILAVEAAALRSTRQKTAKQLESVKRTIEKITQTQTTSKMELERYAESKQSLLKRYSEDYQIDLKNLDLQDNQVDQSDRKTLDREASSLRDDISSVGEINMAALAELDELQARYDSLNGQYEDLVSAKESLQRVIQKINQDSRRMFLETLEIIRTNFQLLYRKCFGGGNADIILEEGDDVLDCGIDILATPPGKTALSNSLLSGGEKALTAVALLLAIFQYRPSPFCVLDEVDAPFDEANIGRFVSVLNEFLDWTKFIIVTHSKKTMTASTTLYGVTMQESGVSKQVAVRFEDVNDKGEIISETKKRKAA